MYRVQGSRGMLVMRRAEASQGVGMGGPRVPCRNLDTLIPYLLVSCLN